MLGALAQGLPEGGTEYIAYRIPHILALTQLVGPAIGEDFLAELKADAQEDW